MPIKETAFDRRKRRIRHKLKKVSPEKVRLSIFRSSKHIYAQIIDDAQSVTLVSASSVDKEIKKSLKSGSGKEAAKAVGALVAERAKAAKITAVAFDRSGYLYHGRVKALADGAREAGLVF